jgi:hypothetical protein
VSGVTLFPLVEKAIQQQVKQSQNATATLNQLTFGAQNLVGFCLSGCFSKPQGVV